VPLITLVDNRKRLPPRTNFVANVASSVAAPRTAVAKQNENNYSTHETKYDIHYDINIVGMTTIDLHASLHVVSLKTKYRAIT